MDFNFQGEGTSNSSFESAVRTCEKDIRAHFTPARQWLQSVLELSRAQVAVLEGENSLARHFHVPFASDSIAQRVEKLFGELRVLKDENGELDNDIRWIDVLLAPTYEPTPREDGSLHLRLDGRKGLIKLSTSDHGLIKTGIPQKLLNPRTYESDVLAEGETMKLVEQELATLNKVASQIIETNNVGLSKLRERSEALEQLRTQPTYSVRADPQAQSQCETSTGSPERTTQASTAMRLWTSEELDRVPQWFRARKHLPQEKVEAQFEQDFGCHRSFGAIQTASYRRSKTKGYRNPRKRRRTLLPDDPSLPPTTTGPARVAETPNIAPQSLTSDSVPRASMSFLDALKSFPRSGIRRAELGQPKMLQAANAEAPSNAADGTSRNEGSSASASASDIRSPTQAGTAALLPTVGEPVSSSLSAGNGKLTQLGSTSDRNGNSACNKSTETSELRTPACFRPINLGSRPGLGAVDVRAHASMTVAMIPTAHRPDTRNTESGPAAHTVAAESGGHIIVTGAQPAGRETRSDLLYKSREGISWSPSQHEHQSLSASVPETEMRTAAGAFGPSRPQSSNTNHPQDLSQMNRNISVTQQTDYTGVQFAEAQESPSHEHHACHTGIATLAGPTPSDIPNGTIQTAPKKKVTRSRTGCSACRNKRVKCDENTPACDNCVRSGLQCDGPRKPRKRGRKPFAQQPKEGSSSLQDNVAERIYSPGAEAREARVIDCTEESIQQSSISEAKNGSTTVSNGGCPNNNSFVWVQEKLPSPLVSPTAHKLPSVANLAAGRHEVPSIRQIFNMTSTSPHNG